MNWLDRFRKKGVESDREPQNIPGDLAKAAHHKLHGRGTVVRGSGLPGDTVAAGVTGVGLLPLFTDGARILDSYTIKRRLGSGAMGKVYLARHEHWDLDVALKVPNAEILADPENRHRIIREAELWTGLGLHPHIAYCYYVQPIDDIPLLVIEYLNGGNLRDWIAEGKCANLRTGLDLAIQFCHALAHAHGKGVVHRDIKPENVLLTQDGTLKITDFGIARAAGAGGEDMETTPGLSLGGQTVGSMGTYEYMPPEQFGNSHDVDSRVDLFAFGVCLYEMFCGRRPYSMAVGARQEAPEPSQLRGDESVPANLSILMRRMCGWDKEERPNDVHEIARELCKIYHELFKEASRWAELPLISMEADGYNNRAMSYLHLSRMHDAEDAWRMALTIDPLHPEATYNQGLYLWRSGQMRDEILLKRLRTVCANRNSDWLPLFLMALIHLERLDCQSAIEALESIPRADSTREEVVNALEAARAGLPGSGGLLIALKGRTSMPLSAVLSADGRRALSGHPDGNLSLWDLEAESCVCTWKAHRSVVNSVCISADARYGLSGSKDRVLKLWDLPAGRCLRTFGGHTGEVWSVCLSRDGRYAISGSEDQTIRVWDTDSCGCLHTLRGHTDAVRTTCVSANGEYVLSGGRDRTLRLWDLVGGNCLHVFEGHDDRVFSISLSDDMRYALSSSQDNTVKLWDITQRCCLRTFERPLWYPTAVCFSTDGHFFVSGNPDSTLQLWEVASGRCLRAFEQPEKGARTTGAYYTSVSLSKGARRAVSTSNLDSICLWDTGIDGKRRIVPFRPSRCQDIRATFQAQKAYRDALTCAQSALQAGEAAKAAAFLTLARSQPGAGRIGEAAELWRTLYARLQRKELREVWGEGSIETPHPSTGAYQSVLSVCFSLDGTYLLSSHGDGTMRLWDVRTRCCVRTFPGHTACLSSKGDYALSGTRDADKADDTLKLWEVSTGRCIQELNFLGHNDRIKSVCLSGDGRYAASASVAHSPSRENQNESANAVRLWDIKTGRCVRAFQGHRERCNSISITPDNRYLLSGGDDRTLKLWDIVSGNCIRTFVGHRDAVLTVVLSPDTLYALSGSGNYDKTMKLWNLADGSCLRSFEGHTLGISSAAFTNDGRYIVSGSFDKTLKMWEVATGRCVRTVEGHSEGVNCCAFTEDGAHLASGGVEHEIKLWTLDWDLRDNHPSDWDESARPYLGSFLSAHRPYAAELPAAGSPTEREIALSLTRTGKPLWTDDDLRRLLCTLGWAGYGWLRPEGIRRELEKMAADWRSS